jgi:hypothetical protein
MADTALTSLTATTSLTTGDLLYSVDGGNSRKILFENLVASIETLGMSADAISSGTFNDSRIAESNVTQHEAAITITESQISDLQSYLTSVNNGDWSGTDLAVVNGGTGASTAADARANLGIHDLGPNAQTGTTYTLVLADRGQTVTMSNASANTLTIPANASVAFDVGTVINVIQLGAGATTIEGDTGVTLNGVSAGSGAINNQYQGVSLLKIATDTWIASGDIATVA